MYMCMHIFQFRKMYELGLICYLVYLLLLSNCGLMLTTAQKPVDDNFILVNDTGCLLFAEKIVLAQKQNSKVLYQQLEEGADRPKCTPSAKVANIEMKLVPGSPKTPGIDISDVTIKMKFNTTAREWKLAEMLLTVDNNKEVPLRILQKMAAPVKLSWACGEPSTYFAQATPKTGEVQYGIRFIDIQVQPFNTSSKPSQQFSEADDCVGFFTEGTWMGIIAMTIFMIIFAHGISMISNLKTMDRFDDPKQKPLQISFKD